MNVVTRYRLPGTPENRNVMPKAFKKAFVMKNPQSTLKDIHLELASIEGGKAYELVAKLEDVPEKTVSGNVSFETSVVAQARIDVPIIVNVFVP